MNKRIWLISDTHLGCRSNSVLWINLIEDYFYNFFIPLAKNEYKEGDILIHLGDVFNNRQTLNLAVQDLGIRIFEELSSIFSEVHILVGNHDIMKKNSNDITSLDCLKYIPNVFIYKKPKILNINGVKCLLMPWRKDLEHENETLKKYSTHNIDYLFCHIETQNIQLNSNKQNVTKNGNTIESFSTFKKVYSGHIHYRQEKLNMTYVGCPYEITRADMYNDKGIYILDLNTHTDIFIKNEKSPKFLKFYIYDILNITMDDFTKQIINNFVDIYIPVQLLNNINISKFIEYFKDISYKFEVNIYDDNVDEFNVNTNGINDNINLLDLSKQYIGSLNYDNLLKDKLYETIKELYNDVLNESKNINID